MIKQYLIPVILDENYLNEMTYTTLNDFIEFKKENELNYCTFNQKWLNNNIIETTWTTTVRFNTNLIQTNELEQKYNSIFDTDDHYYVSKITCQENIHIVEFTIIRHYIKNHQ